MRTDDRTLMDELGQLYAQIPAPPKGLAEGRERMLAAAALLEPALTARKSAGPIPLFRRLSKLSAFRVLSVLAVIIMVATATSGGVILVSASSLPGDRLYPVKLGVEDLRLSLTADPTMQVERNLRFVTERVEEMRGLAAHGETIPGDVVTRMEAQMDLAVGYTIVTPRENASALVEELGRRMYQQQKVLAQIQAEGSQKEDDGALNSALRLAERAYLAANLSEGDPLNMQIQYEQLGRLPEKPNQNNEAPAGAEEAPGAEPEAPQGEHSEQGHNDAVEPGNSNGANSSDESNSPGRQSNQPDSSGLEEPVGPAGSGEPAASAGAAGAKGAGPGNPEKAAAASENATKGRHH